MACFIVPAAEAAVTTVITRVLEKREQQAAVPEYKASESLNNEPFSVRLKRLNSLLWGGSALLAFEHLWHGEIQPFFPFLTAAADPAETAAMLSEMSTAGVMMAVIVTAVWGLSVIVCDTAKKHHRSNASAVTTAEVEG
ncbi:MAG: hypothetical protein Q4D40_06840 [Eubacteriales bacterium]|nr:hypothetical protein [Eubacteriales bacterium]